MHSFQFKINKMFIAVLLNSLLYSQVLVHRHISTNDGLIQGQISAIEQDSKGYIWFGTFDGVSRWDGKEFLNIQSHNGLPASQILDIEEGEDSTIFIAAYGGGILTYKNGIFDTINTESGLTTNNITQILKLNDGGILFGGDDGNISLYKEGKLSNWSDIIDFPKYDVFGIYQSADNKIFFATEKGLVIVDGNEFSILSQKDGLITDYLWSVNGNVNGTIYIGTNRGINKFNNGKISELKFQNKKFRNATFKILVSGNSVYYATNGGILIEDPGTIKLLSTRNGLVSNDFWSISQDNNGLIYFGSNGKGISIYNPNKTIVNYNTSVGLPQGKIFCITQDNTDKYYFGSKEGLITYHKQKFKTVSTGLGIRGDIIEAIYRRRNGQILLGTKNGLKIVSNNKIISFVDHDELNKNEIYSIEETESGQIFLGTRFGVYSIIDKNVNRIEYFDSLGSIYIMSIISKGNAIYFGSFDKGLIIYDSLNFTRLTTAEGLSSNRINSLHLRNNGTILVGTQQGLNLIKNNEVLRIVNQDDGLSNNVIADINEDPSGKIYLSTFKGVNVITNLEDSITIRHINNNDGLVSDECIINGSYIDSNDKMWIATQNGISVYNTREDKKNSTPPKIYFSGIEIFNHDYPLNDFLKNPELNHDQNYLKFFFTGINLVSPDKIKYQYMLSGVDNSWVESNNNSVQYTNLPSNKYTFYVKAKNEWNYWSEPATLSFTIFPGWWETWWFRIIVVSSAGFLLWVAIQYRLNYLLKLERIRTKIASDLHDNIGSGLTEITFLSQMLQRRKAWDDVTNSQVNKISKTAHNLISDMRDIVWLINPSQDTLSDLFHRLKDSSQELLQYLDIKLEVSNIDKLTKVRLPITFRQHLYLIFKEAVNNSIKYSNCKNIKFDIETTKGILIVNLKDDGIGFEIDKIKRGNGLINMTRRAEAVNGKLEIISKINEGTTIIFEGIISKLKTYKV